MGDGEFTITGTKFGYAEWAEAFIDTQLSGLFDGIHYTGNWDLEQAFMHAASEGFTAGYRLIAPFSVKVFFEVTWTREDNTIVLISYKSTDEVRKSFNDEKVHRPKTSAGNHTSRRF